mgnify:CR=1 FL=1
MRKYEHLKNRYYISVVVVLILLIVLVNVYQNNLLYNLTEGFFGFFCFLLGKAYWHREVIWEKKMEEIKNENT